MATSLPPILPPSVSTGPPVAPAFVASGTGGKDFARFAGVVALLAVVGLLLPGRWGLYLMLWALLAYSANNQSAIVAELKSAEKALGG
jgi:hypothetical protein